MAKITVPEEIRAALAKIDYERDLVEAYQREKERDYQTASMLRQNEIFDESQAKTAQVYAALAQRKLDIEAEFAGSNAAVDANIAALKQEIEAEVLALKETQHGKYFMAVYAKGRVGTWNSGKLDGLALILPQIAECRNPGGEPTVTFRAVK